MMVRRLAENLSDRYIVIHAANCERGCSGFFLSGHQLTPLGIDEVKFRVRDLQPDMLVSHSIGCARLWDRQR